MRILGPVEVAQEVARNVIDHNSLIERVIAKEAILPTLLLPSKIMGVETGEFEDRSSVLSVWDGQARGAAMDSGRHRPRSRRFRALMAILLILWFLVCVGMGGRWRHS